MKTKPKTSALRESPMAKLSKQETDMIYDLRTFTVKSGRFLEFMEVHKRIAFPLVLKHLGEPVGYWTTVTGEMNQFVHLWRFDDLSDMEQRQAALNDDPAWRGYVTHHLGESAILQRQQSVLMRPIEIPK
jgi:NIPSNAP